MSDKNATPRISWGGLSSTTSMIGLAAKRRKNNKRTKARKTKRR